MDDEALEFSVQLPDGCEALDNVLVASLEAAMRAGRVQVRQRPTWRVRGRLKPSASVVARGTKRWPTLIFTDPVFADLELACGEVVSPAKAARLAAALEALGETTRQSTYDKWRDEHGA